MKQKESWFKEHPIITGIVLLILFAIVINIIIPNEANLDSEGYFPEVLDTNEEQNSAPTSQAIEVCDAENYIGQEMIVQGKIVQVSIIQGTIFLNFGSRYPNHCFYGVIFSSSSSEFPENIKGFFEGEIVKISGVIEEYQGKPQIILENPEQIEIVK